MAIRERLFPATRPLLSWGRNALGRNDCLWVHAPRPLQKRPLMTSAQEKPIATARPALALDLDECLVSRHTRGKVDFMATGRENARYNIVMRPGLISFLGRMAAIYDLFAFTSSSFPYASSIVRHICERAGDSNLFTDYFASGSLDEVYDPAVVREVRVKDLEKLERDLKRSVWLDDDKYYWVRQPDNGFVVPAFKAHNYDNDKVLEGFVPLLSALAKVDDFPSAIKGLRNGSCKLVDESLEFGGIDPVVFVAVLKRELMKVWLVHSLFPDTNAHAQFEGKPIFSWTWTRTDQILEEIGKKSPSLERVISEEKDQIKMEIEATEAIRSEPNSSEDYKEAIAKLINDPTKENLVTFHNLHLKAPKMEGSLLALQLSEQITQLLEDDKLLTEFTHLNFLTDFNPLNSQEGGDEGPKTIKLGD